MEFLRNNKLRHLGAYLVVLTLIIFVAQYYFIDAKINAVEEAELKIEYTQFAQLHNQKITLHVQQFLTGRREVAPSIAALLEEHDFHLKTLSSGGRLGQRSAFIKPLSRLPRITFDGLQDNWETYRNTILLLLSNHEETNPVPAEPPVQDTIITASAELEGDSLEAIPVQPPVETVKPVLVNATATLTKLQYEGLSLTMSQWYDKLVADLDAEVETKKLALSGWKAGIVVMNGLVLIGLYYFFIGLILKPIANIQQHVSQHRKVEGLPPNELGELAGAINDTIENLKDATDFVMAIGKGDFTLDYKESLDPNYEPGKNRLADSLIEMQQKLRELNEEEQKRKWANEGLARFVDIMRSSDDEISVLGDKIISTLVTYTRSKQGGLYVLNDDNEQNRYLELISLFAWDIKKHEQQVVKPGQGLLGQAFLEKETTYLTDLPEEYVRITSGLGGANPKSVLIVPLKVDRDVYGLVELASFNEFHSHEIAFVEKLGEMIASSLANVRTANKNKVLIRQFKQQREEMKAQEEVMRQNMEELQATQEEVTRKERDYVNRIQELESLLARKSDPVELEEMKARCFRLEQEYERKVSELKGALAESEKRAAHWKVAEEVHQTLQMNLEAIRIAREELAKKST